ncbi:hypothetical protein QY882_01150 [Latilactobacillus sakei]
MLQLLAPAAKDTITVNYKSGATTIWTNTTAAQPTGAYLTYGKAQNVIASKTANGVTWYQLENKGWVPSSYVVLNNPNLAGVTPITDAPAVTPVATTTATTTPAASTTTTTPAATTATSESATQTSTTQQQAPADFTIINNNTCCSCSTIIISCYFIINNSSNSSSNTNPNITN